MKLPKNVERGAELLDREVPGWEGKIDLETLDLASPDRCVLGQAFRVNQHPAYHRGVDILRVSQSSRYGFTPWGRQGWSNLTEAWRKLIESRRAA